MKNPLSTLAAAAVIALGASVLVAPAAWGAATVESAIGVSGPASRVAFSPDGATAYVVTDDPKVSVIDVDKGEEVRTISVGDTSAGVYMFMSSIAISPDGALAYMTVNEKKTVAVITLATDEVSYIPVGFGPRDVAFNPAGTFAYVTNANADTVSVIDVKAGKALSTTIPVGDTPWAVAFSPDGSLAYVANDQSSNITVINAITHTFIENIPLDGRPSSIAFTPNGKTAYVVQWGIGVAGVWVIDVGASKTVEFIETPLSSETIAISPDGSTAFVTVGMTDSVAVIDVATSTLGDALPVGEMPMDVAFSPTGTVAYVTSYADSVSVIRFDPALSASTVPAAAESTSAVSASVAAGVLSASLGAVAFAEVPFSHGVQTVAADVTLAADDKTGLLYGWNVTLQASALVWTSPSHTTDAARNIPAANLSLAAAGTVATTTGDAFIGTKLASNAALGSAVSVFSTGVGQGSGAYTVPLQVSLTVPANAAAGSYAGTLTTTISAAP